MTTSQDFSTYFDTYYPKLYSYIRSRVADQKTAEDLTAAAFERAYRNFQRYDPAKGAFSTWLFTIARNLLINQLAAAGRQPPQAPLDTVGQVPTTRPTPEETLLRREQQQALQQAITILSARDQEIIQLRFFGRLSNRRIAEIMELKEKTVSVIILRALRKLKTELQDPEEGP